MDWSWMSEEVRRPVEIVEADMVEADRAEADRVEADRVEADNEETAPEIATIEDPTRVEKPTAPAVTVGADTVEAETAPRDRELVYTGAPSAPIVKTELVTGKDPLGLYIFRLRRCSRLKSPDDISFFSTSIGIILLDGCCRGIGSHIAFISSALNKSNRLGGPNEW